MPTVAPEIQSAERYASQVGELWDELSQTLARLEGFAAAPDLLDDDETVGALRRLQYQLHTASESALGLSPPAAAEPAHSELAAALTGARDATGDVVEAADVLGARGVDALLHEWRGALFRVRLARLRLTGGGVVPAAPQQEQRLIRTPLMATILTVVGAAAFAVGATAGPWPLWVAGMLAICISLLMYRP
jgi:hypothetical protein